MVRQSQPIKTLTAFRAEARKTLWAQDSGSDKGALYRQWERRIEELEKTGLTRPQAMVTASKEFPCLTRLFRQFDLSHYDPDPNLAPVGTGAENEARLHSKAEPALPIAQLSPSGVPESKGLDVPTKPTGVVCDNVEATHLDNLRWAADAAGHFMRTNKSPRTCPNNSAWFLFRMAIEDHKAFLDKLHGVEMRARDDAEREASLRNTSNRGIEEIECMLKAVRENVDYHERPQNQPATA